MFRFRSLLLLLLVATLSWSTLWAAEPAGPLMPYIDGQWWQVAGDPDLGAYTTERQQPVDFALWQAADGTWQIWSCIRGTACGGNSRLFHGWEGKHITDRDWKPMGVQMEADPSLGETAGGLQAPHVVEMDGTYHMLYGDWENICLATSKDGKKFERHITPDGTTALFTEGKGANTRDVIAMQVDDTWYGYYTAYPNRQGAVYCRTSKDLKNWGESVNVSFGGRAGVNPFAAECPHVIARHGRYYLFRTQKYGQQARSAVYHSTDPLNFGINQDRLYYLTEMPIAAPEIVHHEGQDYIAVLLPNLKGIQIAKLGWTLPPEQGSAVQDLADPQVRNGWKITSGELPNTFTQSKRQSFDPPMSHFIGTAELPDHTFDDRLRATVESAPIEIDTPWMFAYVSGGTDSDKLHVALVDADTGLELTRISPAQPDNTLVPQLINTSPWLGRSIKVRVVDDSQDEWGHINFGGLFRGIVKERTSTSGN